MNEQAATSKQPGPPRAVRRPYTHHDPHGERSDPYHWLRNRDSDEVLAHLRAETAYCEAELAAHAPDQEQLFDEIVARIKDDDSSVPVLEDGYWWYRRVVAGQEYPLYCRREDTPGAEEEIYLDVNAIAGDALYCSVSGLAVSRDNRWLAYHVDLTGDRIYTLHIRDLDTGEDVAEVCTGAAGFGCDWAADCETLFYTRIDLETLRAHEVWRHQRGSDPSADVRIFHEEDPTFDCAIWLTRSKRYLVISSTATLSNEHWLIPSDDPHVTARCFLPREPEHEHDIDHLGEYFYIVTNMEAVNNRVMRCGEHATGMEQWQELVPHDEAVLIEECSVFRDHLVIEERRDGLTGLRVLTHTGDFVRDFSFDEPAFVVALDENPDPQSKLLRFSYQSLTTPATIYQEPITGGERELLKRYDLAVPYDPADYVSERVHATAADGERVPISLVYRRDQHHAGQAQPMFLYAYGAYGMSMDPFFNPARISLLDRGVIFAIAHVRGGKELGRRWYDHGRMEHKWNTFTDTIACVEHLIAASYTSADRLALVGASAGGLLVGTVINERPELCAAAILDVPFVDVVSTMLDDSLPLTTGEYDEWGNPNEQPWYEIMCSYSPYDNLRAQAYPATLVATGYNDSQVQYWEPAKYVARMRELRTDDRPLLFYCEMEVGHGGRSGRFDRWREAAREYAFVLWQIT